MFLTKAPGELTVPSSKDRGRRQTPAQEWGLWWPHRWSNISSLPSLHHPRFGPDERVFPPSLFPSEAGMWSRRGWKHQQDSQLPEVLSAAGDPKPWGDQESPDQVHGETPAFNQWWFPKDVTKIDLLLFSPCLPGEPGGARALRQHPSVPSHPPTPAPGLAFRGDLCLQKTRLSTPRCAVRLPCLPLACPAFYFSMDTLNGDVLGF